jgi:hypothetical protein
MKYTLEFSEDGPACAVQAIAIAQYEAIWAAQYSSRDEAEASLKSQGVVQRFAFTGRFNGIA